MWLAVASPLTVSVGPLTLAVVTADAAGAIASPAAIVAPMSLMALLTPVPPLRPRLRAAAPCSDEQIPHPNLRESALMNAQERARRLDASHRTRSAIPQRLNVALTFLVVVLPLWTTLIVIVALSDLRFFRSFMPFLLSLPFAAPLVPPLSE
jgi:hypothetical protein